MNKPSIALIDGDLWCYDIPFAAQSGLEEDRRPSIDYCITAAEQRMEHILKSTGCQDIEFYLTGKTNFRNDVATIQTYKAGRGEKPALYNEMRKWVEFKWNAITVEGMEADDMLAIRQTHEKDKSVIVSRDKDLRMVEGWHYGYTCGKQKEFPLTWISEMGYLDYNKKLTGGGMKWFFAQLLMGDKTDNIQGVKGVGAKKAYDALSDLSTSLDMFKTSLDMYDNNLEDLLENGNLLWMVTHLKEDGSPIMFSETDFCKELING